MVQMEVTLVSTSENDIIFKSKIILPLIELKCFKTIALNNDLILEAGIDSNDKSDVKRKRWIFIHKNKLFYSESII